MPSKRNLTSQELPIDQNNIFNKSILFIIYFIQLVAFYLMKVMNLLQIIVKN